MFREVWNGSIISAAGIPSEQPPLQACPTSLATLEATNDRPLWLSTRDGRSFFDQLAVPSAVRPFLGRPVVSVADLLCPPPCESGSITEKGLTAAKIGEFLEDGLLESGDCELTPVCACWPMGFGWSSYVAQSTMVASCLDAGFAEHELLSSERLHLPDTTQAVAVDAGKPGHDRLPVTNLKLVHEAISDGDRIHGDDWHWDIPRLALTNNDRHLVAG